jgi:tRNA threonylcarbamoyladenosine biosynthesis protein TsaB
MKLLAVDTALGACSAALLDGDAVLAHQLVVMERGHAEALAPMVQALMQQARVPFADIERLAVTTGPGTFTGQRVGLAFMRGLRVALKRPLIGITTLEAMAAAAMAETGAFFAAVLHDAKRSEVYAGLFSRDGVVLSPALLPFEDAVAAIGTKIGDQNAMTAFAGTAGSRAAEHYEQAGGRAVVTTIVHPDALWVGRLAMGAPDSDSPPKPLYLRPPDARLPQKPP